MFIINYEYSHNDIIIRVREREGGRGESRMWSVFPADELLSFLLLLRLPDHPSTICRSLTADRYQVVNVSTLQSDTDT